MMRRIVTESSTTRNFIAQGLFWFDRGLEIAAVEQTTSNGVHDFERVVGAAENAATDRGGTGRRQTRRCSTSASCEGTAGVRDLDLVGAIDRRLDNRRRLDARAAVRRGDVLGLA